MSKFDLVKLMWYHNKVRWKVRRLSGAPPLSFKGRGKNLKNYRIYGNTVNGESVGDRTGNLFDISTIVEGKYISSSGVEEASTAQYQENVLNHTDFINISNDTVYSLTCTMPYGIALDNTVAFCWFDDNKSLISRSTNKIGGINVDVDGYSFSATSPSNAVYLIINFIGYVDGTTYMFNTGSEPLPYEPYGYRVPVTVTNGTNTETTNIYLPEPIKMVGDEAEYIDYGEQKQHRVRKNLLKSTMARQIINGVTFTANEDGSITCNGTAGASAPSVLNITFTLPIELYEVSGCPDSGGNSTYRVDIRNNDSSVCNYNGHSVIDNGTGCLFDGGNNKNYCIRIAPGYTCDNLTFYPMICKVDIEDDTYEPYITNTELDVTLPALPTISGTNTLSVGTEVQPSEVYVEGKIRFIHEGSGENEGE